VPVFGEPGKPWECFDYADEHLDTTAETPLPEPKAYSFAPSGG
jgi:hypothetical protein